jgi:hypothetical protein
MFCRQCGAALDESSQVCQSCGTAASAGTVDGVPQSNVTGAHSSRRIVAALVAGVLVISIAAVALIAYRHTQPVPTSAAPSGAVTSAADSTLGGPSLPDGNEFRWSGLAPEQIQAARGALDAAIAHEEQIAGRAPARSAQDQNSVDARPVAAGDRIRL